MKFIRGQMTDVDHPDQQIASFAAPADEREPTYGIEGSDGEEQDDGKQYDKDKEKETDSFARHFTDLAKKKVTRRGLEKKNRRRENDTDSLFSGFRPNFSKIQNIAGWDVYGMENGGKTVYYQKGEDEDGYTIYSRRTNIPPYLNHVVIAQ